MVLLRFDLEFTLPSSFAGTTGDALRALAAYLRANPDTMRRDDREAEGKRWREDRGDINGRTVDVYRGVALKKDAEGVWRVWQGTVGLH